ncbi:MAG: rhodanese-like domain-containing protein [Rubrivivax sp.]|nr:rhodanese-like domain-containing protein [Rubrivivax sp.]
MKRFMLTSLAVVFLAFNFGCAQKAVAPAQTKVTPAANTVSALKMAKDEGAIDKAFFNKIVADKAANVSLVDVRTNFEFAAGNFAGSKHVSINEIYSEGCPATIAKLPKDGFVVFVCATGARAGEMYFGLKDDCKMDMKRFAFLDAEVMFGPKGPVVK